MEQLIYNPWILAVGGPLMTAIVIWCCTRTSAYLKRKSHNSNKTSSQPNQLEYVRSLVLIIDRESRNNIQFKKLSQVVNTVYQEKGYEASLLSYSRTTGRLEIKMGMRKDIISKLIGMLVLEFKIKQIDILES